MTASQLGRASSSALLVLLSAVGGCATPDDGYVLLRRQPVRPDGAPTVLTYAAPNDAGAPLARRLLAGGFGAELLRTYAMAKRFAGQTDPTYVALGVSDMYQEKPYRDRVLEGGWLRSTLAAETPILWIDPQEPEQALRHLVEGVGNAIVGLIAPEPDQVPFRLNPLREGYVKFLTVVAAEWRAADGDSGKDDPRASLRRDPLFAQVRSNAGAVTDGEADLHHPVLIATMLHRLASSAAGRRMALDPEYLPFLQALPPPGVPAGALLGAVRNFQAKLFLAWASAAREGSPPRDLRRLVEAYARTFPKEREDVMHIFWMTTHPQARGHDPRMLHPARARPPY
jgi:hypothetical protein